MSTPRTEKPDFGQWVEGFDVPVVNERSVRAAAGLLFLVGFLAVTYAFYTGDFQPVRGFGFLFLIDMGIRIGFDYRFAPSMILGALAVRRQRPEWVEARPKRVAWLIGFGLAFTACMGMGFLGIQNVSMLALCSLCLAVMFLEAAFGICVGCEIYRRFAKTPPTLCAGDVCTYQAPTRRSLFTRSEPHGH